MTGRDREGGGFAPSPGASGRSEGAHAIIRYPRNPRPDKAVRYAMGSRTIALKGQQPALADALITASRKGMGVAAVEMSDALVNPGDAVCSLRAKGVLIDVRRGKPNRYVLRTAMTRLEATA